MNQKSASDRPTTRKNLRRTTVIVRRIVNSFHLFIVGQNKTLFLCDRMGQVIQRTLR